MTTKPAQERPRAQQARWWGLTALIVALAFGAGYLSLARRAVPKRQVEPSAQAVETGARPLEPMGPVVVSSSQPAATGGKSRQPGVVPVYHPRPASEWQGMLVDLNGMPYCEALADCPMGLACRLQEKKCGPCSNDRDCDRGERCVLDRCLLKEHVTCRVASECKAGELCILTELGRSGRGNEEMRSQCLDERSGSEQPRVEYPPEAFVGPETPSSRLATKVAAEAAKATALPEEPLPAVAH